jgi:pimeloyl-ACP methyl ester carboxylesterase
MSVGRRVRAWYRAVVLISVVLDAPLLSRIVARFTPTPIVEALELAGVPVEIFRPPGERPRPAWIFVNGAHPLRRREPVVWRLAQGLARAGYLVVVPDVPGLGEGMITSRTVLATETVTRATCERSDVRGGRVALIGASTGAGLALLAASRADLSPRVTVVAAVAPFADLRKLTCLTTTGSYSDEGGFAPYEVTALHRQVVARSLVAALAEGRDRERLLAELSRVEEQGLNPLEELAQHADDTGEEARAVLALLTNREPDRHADLYEALPVTVRSFIDELSPLRVAHDIQAPIEVVVPPSDVYFPLAEAVSLGAALPNARLTVTRTLDHTRPTASLTRLKDFAAFGRFVARGLAAAA